jgi:hypothetical protein
MNYVEEMKLIKRGDQVIMLHGPLRGKRGTVKLVMKDWFEVKFDCDLNDVTRKCLAENLMPALKVYAGVSSEITKVEQNDRD